MYTSFFTPLHLPTISCNAQVASLSPSHASPLQATSSSPVQSASSYHSSSPFSAQAQELSPSVQLSFQHPSSCDEADLVNQPLSNNSSSKLPLTQVASLLSNRFLSSTAFNLFSKHVPAEANNKDQSMHPFGPENLGCLSTSVCRSDISFWPLAFGEEDGEDGWDSRSAVLDFDPPFANSKSVATETVVLDCSPCSRACRARTAERTGPGSGAERRASNVEMSQSVLTLFSPDITDAGSAPTALVASTQSHVPKAGSWRRDINTHLPAVVVWNLVTEFLSADVCSTRTVAATRRGQQREAAHCKQ
eukprot:CAMPEP_0169263510 /NCGR_PEP_ID=MMETSP1016-20121227/44463_1 /TAXON_ID=342587 /ORGANISM="Karlodinium micrum, Strain CCMP2283" /LENGTH=304 /DNA_ID=CAMNT_0009346475 /DNA_START=188 /DNA_END=1102 /DNA_ORIENTATION=-